MTKQSPVETRVYNPVSNNLSKLSIMPKACRSSYNLAFKLKVVAEAVDNNSAITRDNDSLLAKRSSEPFKWRAENVSKTKGDGLLLAKVS